MVNTGHPSKLLRYSPGRSGKRPGLAVPQGDLEDSNAATPVIHAQQAVLIREIHKDDGETV